MATTDTKPGFRLPWSSDRSESANPDPNDSAGPVAATSPESAQETETAAMPDAVPAAPDHVAAPEVTADPPGTMDHAVQTAPVAPVAAPVAPRRPNKFMAELTRAMQTAAEAAREDTLARFNAEAKTYIEGIHTESATEATNLRKEADEDVAGIREWSKAEIARIREETDEKIARRKRSLESEIEEHAAAIEARIERVQSRVTAFENEMAAFFERLFAEEDPTRFAAMAESLPEPPPFDGPMADRPSAWASAPVASAASVVDPAAPASETAPPAPASETVEPIVDAPEAILEYAPTQETPAPDTTSWEAPSEASLAPDPAWGMPDSAWGTPETTPGTPDVAAAPTNPATIDTGDLFGAAIDASVDADAADPRVAALGLTPDFAAAEAEAAADATADDSSTDEVAPISDEAIAARLAGLVPEDAPTDGAISTRVVVNGLISVASIAGFKRHLSRAAGVHSVGVSSGPDGEFVFTVSHAPGVDLGGVITTLPGFGARITASTDGELTVAAHDPEAEG